MGMRGRRPHGEVTCDAQRDAALRFLRAAMAPVQQPLWSSAVIESAAAVVEATDPPGMTGTQIGQLLAQL